MRPQLCILHHLSSQVISKASYIITVTTFSSSRSFSFSRTSLLMLSYLMRNFRRVRLTSFFSTSPASQAGMQLFGSSNVDVGTNSGLLSSLIYIYLRVITYLNFFISTAWPLGGAFYYKLLSLVVTIAPTRPTERELGCAVLGLAGMACIFIFLYLNF